MLRPFPDGADELDRERRRVDTRRLALLFAVLTALVALARPLPGSPLILLAQVILGAASAGVVLLLVSLDSLMLASAVMLSLPLVQMVFSSLALGHMGLIPFWSVLTPLIAGALLPPKGVLAAFALAAVANGLCWWGLHQAPVVPYPPATTALAALFLTCFATLASMVAASGAARALAESRRRVAGERAAERRYRSRLLEMQEGERRSVARELHDGFGQILTALRLSVQATLRVPPERRAELGAESLALVDQAMSQVRELALALRPAVLDDLGLAAALSSDLGRQARLAGLSLELNIGEGRTRLPPQIETASFRVAQEALTNVARHANASRVVVTLERSREAAELSIADDGRGFDLDAARARARAGESLGLLSMDERVSLAGGAFRIDSAAGKGTTVRARFPLPAQVPT